MPNLSKHTKTKPKPKRTLIFKNCSRVCISLSTTVEHNTAQNKTILYIILPSVCLCALTLYPATNCAAATDISGVSGRSQLSR